MPRQFNVLILKLVKRQRNRSEPSNDGAGIRLKWRRLSSTRETRSMPKKTYKRISLPVRYRNTFGA